MSVNAKRVRIVVLIAVCLLCTVTGFRFNSNRTGAARATDLIVIKGGRLIEGTGRPPIENAVIIIEGEKIKAVFREGEAAIPGGASVIDATGKTVLPGLIDVHVHFGGLPGAGTSPDEFGPQRRLHDLKAFLYSGVTTFKSLGDDQKSILALRARDRVEHRLSPRVFAVGRVFTAPGGHPVSTVFKGSPRDVVEANVYQIETEDDARAAISQQVADHVDGIKIILDSGPSAHPLPRLKVELLRLIVAEAHKNGFIVSVHCGKAQDVIDAVTAGADGIEHADQEGLSDETLRMMVARGTFYTPTLAVFGQWVKLVRGINPADDPLVRGCVAPGLLEGLKKYQSDLIETMKKTPAIAAAIERRFAIAKLNTRRAIAAGVKVCAGTDAGNKAVFFGPALHQELAFMVEAGLTPLQAITAATRNAAAYIGVPDKIGTVERGKLADLLLVNGNPMSDIKATASIWMVIKSGQPIDRVALFGN